MHKTIKKKHITTLLAAMAAATTGFALTTVNDDVEVTGNVAVGGDVTVRGNLVFEGGLSVGASTSSVPLAVGSSLKVVDGPLVPGDAITTPGSEHLETRGVYTGLDDYATGSTTTQSGGLAIDAQGNTTITRGTTEETVFSNISRALKTNIYKSGTLDPVTGDNLGGQLESTREAFGVFGEDGTTFTELSVSPAVKGFLTAGDSNGLFTYLNDPANAAERQALVDAGVIVDNPETYVPGSGNLTVEGTTTTNGIVNTGTLETESLTVGGVAAATVDDVAVVQGNLDVESAARADADAALQANLDAETATRDAADAALQAGIDAESATRAAGDAALQANIDTETAARQTADAALQSAIDQEVADRTALIRQEADGSIHIGANSLITNEVGGEQQLYAQDGGGNAIDINITNGSGLKVDGVDVATVDDVAAEAGRAIARENQIETDSIARDNALGVRIDNEEAARIAGDNLLQANIDAETLRATNRENQIETDSIARDNALGVRIDDEAATRASEDTLIRADIAAEAATRAAADTTLQANIDAEAVTRADADTVLGQRIDNLNTSVTSEVGRLDGRIDGLEGRTAALEGRVSRVERDVRSLRKGIAMAAALQTPIIEPGKNNAVKFGAAVYDGEQGLGLGYARRINQSVQVNVDVATGFPETVARGGVNFSF